MKNYTDKEMMALCAGRLVPDGAVLFAGTGLSMLAATVAKRIHAPESVVFFETGGIDPALDELPLAVADPRVMSGSAMNAGLIEAFSILGHRRLSTIAFLGAAQIDPYGNLNSTVLGDYRHPKVRFPGSGGACDAASLAWGVIIFMQHEKKTLRAQGGLPHQPRLARRRRLAPKSRLQAGAGPWPWSPTWVSSSSTPRPSTCTWPRSTPG